MTKVEIWFLLAMLTLTYVAYFNARRYAKLRRFWQRRDTLIDWQREFPSRKVEEITMFLRIVNEAFAFDPKYVFRLLPSDMFFDIYKATDPAGVRRLKVGGRYEEVECFNELLKDRFGLALADLPGDDWTLGSIFEHTTRLK